jgi:hypothetical protein
VGDNVGWRALKACKQLQHHEVRLARQVDSDLAVAAAWTTKLDPTAALPGTQTPPPTSDAPVRTTRLLRRCKDPA